MFLSLMHQLAYCAEPLVDRRGAQPCADHGCAIFKKKHPRDRTPTGQHDEVFECFSISALRMARCERVGQHRKQLGKGLIVKRCDGAWMRRHELSSNGTCGTLK